MASTECKADPAQQRTFVAVHGVGRQLEFATLRTLIEGSHLVRDSRIRYSRAELEAIHGEHGGLVVDETGQFAEICYSPLIADHTAYSERDLRQWIKTFRGRLESIHRKRSNERMPDFSGIDLVVDDILLTTRVAKLLAERLKLSPLSLESSAQGFIQQLQLFFDRPSYREAIIESVSKQIAGLSAVAGSGKLVLVTHSLGTVVTFIAILRAQLNNTPWLNNVERFITFGSPLDLVLVLFEELFPKVTECYRRIPWTNYTLLNDPIATDLKVTSRWFLPNSANGLFENNAVREVLLGAGSLATAHTDYWHHAEMLWDIYANPAERSPESEVGPPTDADPAPGTSSPSILPERQSHRRTTNPMITGFALSGLAAVLASAWTALIWWEENLKSHDADRVAIIDEGLHQLLAWLGIAALVFSHAMCWSASVVARIGGALASCLFAGLLYANLPPLLLFGVKPDGAKLPDMPPGSAVLWLVPLTALIGCPFENRRLGNVVFVLLAVLTVFLSLFVGTRTNPSNVTEEFGLLALVFGFWLLAILLFRTHRVYRDYVRGRKHIDVLHELWSKKDPAAAR